MPARAAPSFDCRKAASETGQAICASPALSLLDRQQQGAWRAMNEALQEHPAFSALKQEQRAWLALRERCAADTACIAQACRRRISQLQGGPGEPWAGLFEMPGTGSLEIANDAAAQSAAGSLCGNGGSFAFRCRRISADL